MFGIIYLLYEGCKTLLGIGSQIVETQQDVNKTYDPETNTYVDSAGIRRSCDDGVPTVVRWNATLGAHVAERYTKVSRNLTAERAQRIFEYYLENPSEYVTAVQWQHRVPGADKYQDRAELCNGCCVGNRFKDLQTGRWLVVRYVHGHYVYMDAETGELLRATDGEVKYRKALNYANITVKKWRPRYELRHTLFNNEEISFWYDNVAKERVKEYKHLSSKQMSEMYDSMPDYIEDINEAIYTANKERETALNNLDPYSDSMETRKNIMFLNFSLPNQVNAWNDRNDQDIYNETKVDQSLWGGDLERKWC